MTWRRSKSNAQQIRTLRRIHTSLRRAEDERIARLAAQTTGGVR
ncbi:hypothetical protein [Actinoplanes regularis]|nr:hypothetical protein [Actinoplanes regularis]